MAKRTAGGTLLDIKETLRNLTQNVMRLLLVFTFDIDVLGHGYVSVEALARMETLSSVLI